MNGLNEDAESFRIHKTRTKIIPANSIAYGIFMFFSESLAKRKAFTGTTKTIPETRKNIVCAVRRFERKAVLCTVKLKPANIVAIIITAWCMSWARKKTSPAHDADVPHVKSDRRRNCSNRWKCVILAWRLSSSFAYLPNLPVKSVDATPCRGSFTGLPVAADW